MVFIWRDGQFYGSKVGFVEKYNEALKKRPILSTKENINILSEYYNTLSDVNEKVICS